MKKYLFSALVALGALTLQAQNADFKILCLNDLHSAVKNMPRLAFVVDSIRQQCPDALLFAAGDIRTGDPINDMYPTPNQPMVEMMNAIGFNLSTMGNHECDGGVESFVYTVNNSNFPYVAANVYPADSLRLHLYPYRMFEKDGVRMAVLGLVQLNDMGIPDGHPAKFKGIRFTTPEKEIENYAWLRDQANVLVGLTHMGIERDTLVADAHPEFDLLICGHSHDLVPGTLRNGVMLAQAKRWAEWLNEVDIKVRDGKVVDRKCKTICVKAATGSDPRLEKMYADYSEKCGLHRLVARAVTPFVEKEELGCMMADAIRDIAEADLAIVNAGGVRYNEKEAGGIYLDDVLRLDPFGNDLMTVELTGDQLVEALAQIPQTDEYGPAYVSGFTYTIKPNKKGYDVKVFDADGKKFNKQKTYKVAVNSYVISVTPVLSALKANGASMTTADALIKYLEKEKTVDYKGQSRVKIEGVSHR